MPWSTPALPEAAPAGLAAYLQGLWGAAVRLTPLAATPHDADLPPRPVLSGRDGKALALHLPAFAEAMPRTGSALAQAWAEAAASHAAAHWHFGAQPWPRAGLKPVQQALLGTLEDARVEALAMLELPGLRRLWLRFHAGDDAPQGSSFEALLARLAHSLLDPSHTDPHPWIAKVRAAFLAEDGRSLRLRTPESLRTAASLLGNDIGQMRLPFNSATWRVHAAYRDDNSHLWLFDPDLQASDTPLQADAGAGAQVQSTGTSQQAATESPQAAQRSQATTSAVATPSWTYPEWDQRIRRYRTDWCRVFMLSPSGQPRALTSPVSARAMRLKRQLSRLKGAPVRGPTRRQDGDELHPLALVDWQLAQRLRQPPDPRLYRQVLRPAPTLSVLLLLDASLSSARAMPPGPHGESQSLLALASTAVLPSLSALQALGHRCALWAFSSNGRHQVDVPCIKDWEENAASPEVTRRLALLRPGGSTRLGAVLRHATAQLRAQAMGHGASRPVIVLITDGEPHDIDVHDPAYLSADLARAAREAQRQGLAVRCLLLPPGEATRMNRLLGAGHCAMLRHVDELPVVLPGVLERSFA